MGDRGGRAFAGLLVPGVLLRAFVEPARLTAGALSGRPMTDLRRGSTVTPAATDWRSDAPVLATVRAASTLAPQASSRPRTSPVAAAHSSTNPSGQSSWTHSRSTFTSRSRRPSPR